MGISTSLLLLILLNILHVAMVTWMILTAAEPLDHGYPRASVVYTCGCFGAGVILATVLMFYWRVGLYFLPGSINRLSSLNRY